MTLALAVAGALTLVLLIALTRIHRLAELHHGYYGAALVALAYAFHWPLWVAWVGIALLADDDVQHVAESLGLVPPFADFTPIHKLGAWLLARLTALFARP